MYRRLDAALAPYGELAPKMRASWLLSLIDSTLTADLDNVAEQVVNVAVHVQHALPLVPDAHALALHHEVGVLSTCSFIVCYITVRHCLSGKGEGVQGKFAFAAHGTHWMEIKPQYFHV